MAALLGVYLVFLGPLAVLAAGIAWLCGGAAEFERAAWGIGASLLPAMLFFLLAVRSLSLSYLWQMASTLGGTVGRMFLTLGFALPLYWLNPACRGATFWVWLASGYLVGLGIEVWLLVGALRARSGQGQVPRFAAGR